MVITMPAKPLSKVKLAVKLGLSRTTLQKYLAQDGAPKANAAGLFDVAKVRAWIAEHSSANVEGSAMRDLRSRKLQLEIEAQEHELRRKRGESIYKAEIAPAIAAFNAELAINLKQKFEIELPQKYRGKNLVECQQINAAAVDFVMERLRAGQWALGIQAEGAK